MNVRAKPNSRATIAVLCPYIFFAEGLKDVMTLLPEAEIVPDFTAGPSGTQYPASAKRDFRTWLAASGMPWRDLELETTSPSDFFGKYGTVVAPFYGGLVQHPALKKHRKARVFYGGAKELWGFALWNTYFDLVCTPGAYYSDALHELYGKRGVRIVSTGDPKLDALTTLTQEAARREIGTGSALPVVLVASTWGKLSALGRIAGSLTSLTDRYTIIVKAHHMHAVFDHEILRAFDGTAVRLMDQRTSVATAIAAADVVVSDASGALFDALLADKPVVVLDTLTGLDDEFHIENAFYGVKNPKLAGVPTHEDSTEMRVREPAHQIGPVLNLSLQPQLPQELQRVVEEALRTHDRFGAARELLRRSHFLPLDGKASERVAEAIRALAQSEVAASNDARLFRKLLDDATFRAMSQERNGMRAYRDELAAEARRLRALKDLPLVARMGAVFHEFFE